MIQLALHIVFDDLELVKIDLGVFVFNKPAIQSYHRFGFKIYKVLPNRKEDKWTLLRMNLDKQDWKK